MFSNFTIGDEVAVMPAVGTDPSETLEILKSTYVGAVIILVADGRSFARLNGRGLNNQFCIEIATDLHREAVQQRSRQNPVEV